MTVSGYDQNSDAAWRRMFERDKDLLRQLGIPLDCTPPTPGRWNTATWCLRMPTHCPTRV